MHRRRGTSMKPAKPRSSPNLRDTVNGSLQLKAESLNLVPRRDRRSAPPPSPDLRFIRLHEVLEICGKSRSSVYESIKRGEFPPTVKLCGRSSAWVKSEVIQWAEACIRVSRS